MTAPERPGLRHDVHLGDARVRAPVGMGGRLGQSLCPPPPHPRMSAV